MAEFLDASAALWAARRCTESAVRLVASLRGSMQTLLEEALVGHSDLKCGEIQVEVQNQERELK